MTSANGQRAGSPPSPLRFLFAFTCLFAALYFVYLKIPDELLRSVVYPDALGRPAASVINTIAPAERVRVDGNRLSAGGASLRIVRGCDGVGILLLLIAAIVAYPASARARLLGVLGACGFVYALNEGRIVILYFVLAHRDAWFAAVHVYLLPTFLVAAGATFFGLWVAKSEPARLS